MNRRAPNIQEQDKPIVPQLIGFGLLAAAMVIAIAVCRRKRARVRQPVPIRTTRTAALIRALTHAMRRPA